MVHSPQFLKLVQDAKQRVKETNVPDVKRRIDAGEKMILVDVREDNEWAKGHLPGAVHMGKGVIERDIEQKVPDARTKLVLYCGGGFRSALVAENLQRGGRIRTSTVLINSEVSYRLDHAPAADGVGSAASEINGEECF
jgi:rhodanese-related sulfurtransferase